MSAILNTGDSSHGVRVTSDGGRHSRRMQATRAAAAKQAGHGFSQASALPSTAQWTCPACRFPNLGRAERCGGCGEDRA